MKDERKPEELTFEEAMTALEAIVLKLEKGEATLDEMLSLYEQGTALMRRCNALLSDAQRRVEVVEADKILPFES